MGRHLKLKANLAAATLAGLFIASASASLAEQAEADVPAKEIFPVMSLHTPLARDADTFEGDKTLYAACRKTNQTKSECLCVTHIMKYELTLSEHSAATRLYGQPINRSELHKTLQNEGYTAYAIGMAEQLEQSLSEDPDFAMRCTEAKTYYKSSAK